MYIAIFRVPYEPSGFIQDQTREFEALAKGLNWKEERPIYSFSKVDNSDDIPGFIIAHYKFSTREDKDN